MSIGWNMSKVEGEGSDWPPPPHLKASCNYFFFEASRVNINTIVTITNAIANSITITTTITISNI